MQAELILQGGLADRLAVLEGVGVVVFGDVGVGGRVKHIDVDAVEDAAGLVLFLAQQAVQAVAEPGVQNFLRVGGADRRDLVGSLDGAFHKVGAAVVLDDMGVARTDAAGILEDVEAVLALVGDVVDGEHRLDAVELVEVTVVQVEVHRRERGLPVVAVDDVGLEIGVEQHLEDGARKESEALAVVVEAVQAAALEVILVVDKVVGDAVVLGLEQAAVLAAPADRHAEVGDVGQRVFKL